MTDLWRLREEAGHEGQDRAIVEAIVHHEARACVEIFDDTEVARAEPFEEQRVMDRVWLELLANQPVFVVEHLGRSDALELRAEQDTPTFDSNMQQRFVQQLSI